MIEPFADASDADLADQALPVGDPDGETDPSTDYATASLEADTADLIEQQQEVPSADDDYDRG